MNDLAQRTALRSEAIRAEKRQAVEFAFDVLNNHHTHSKGYVAIAIRFIEQFGCPEDQKRLVELQSI